MSVSDTIDGSQNNQWMKTNYVFDQNGVLQDAHGLGHFVSHSGFSIRDGAAFDTTLGRIDQQYEVIYVGPGSVSPDLRVGVARLKLVATDSKTLSRDGSINVSHG